MSNGFVVAMGMGTVFFGLIILILLCMLMSFICQKLIKETPAPAAAVSKTSVDSDIQNRGEVIAAVSAVIAEELGTDVSAIKVLSFKRV